MEQTSLQAGQACMRKVVHLSRLFGHGRLGDVAATCMHACMDMHPSINDPQGIFSTLLTS
jgi:hypothetical protein